MRTSSTSPFRNRSRANAAIARASAKRRRVAVGELGGELRSRAATNCAALRPAVMKRVVDRIELRGQRNTLVLSAPHRPLSAATRMTARAAPRASSSGCVKSTGRVVALRWMR